jgi:hypothetical protein
MCSYCVANVFLMMQLQLLSLPVPWPAAVAGGEGQKILGNAGKDGTSNGKAETCGGNAEKDGSSNGNTATYVGMYASSY